jgi:hypothetical protein
MQKIAWTIMLATMSWTAVAGDQSRRQAYERLQSRWMGEQPLDVPNKCGLPVLTFAAANPAEVQKLGIQLRALYSRPTTQKSILRGSFRIHYDTTGGNEPAMLDAQYRRIPNSANQLADSVGAIANYCLQYERDVLGYLPPPSDGGAGGGTETDIYLQDLGSTYGLTTPENPINNKPDGGTFTNFITIDNDFEFVTPDSNKGLPGLRVTLAHELHHAIQIGNYGYWANDIFFYEITSVWMEDAVFTGVNDYLQYLRSASGHFRHPELSFMTNDFIMYSRGIWGHYVAKRFGRDAMRKCWEEVRNVRPPLAIDATLLHHYRVSFRNAFVEWSTWNRFTSTRSDTVLYYPEAHLYPRVVGVAVDFTSSTRNVSGAMRAFAAQYVDIDTRVDKFPIVNLNLDAALNAPNTEFSYTLQLATTKLDESYSMIGDRVFAKLAVSDAVNWFMPGAVGSASPFPNPFHANGKSVISFPSPTTASGTLSIFTLSMDLTHISSTFPKSINGMNVFQWNGTNENGDVAASGVYFYVIDAGGERIVGKFALLRK